MPGFVGQYRTKTGKPVYLQVIRCHSSGCDAAMRVFISRSRSLCPYPPFANLPGAFRYRSVHGLVHEKELVVKSVGIGAKIECYGVDIGEKIECHVQLLGILDGIFRFLTK